MAWVPGQPDGYPAYWAYDESDLVNRREDGDPFYEVIWDRHGDAWIAGLAGRVPRLRDFVSVSAELEQLKRCVRNLEGRMGL
jgi:hypothetical protein